MPDKPMKGPSQARQKITIGLIIVIVAVLLWQVKGLIGGGSAPAPTPPPAASSSKMSPGTLPQTTAGTAAPAAPAQQMPAIKQVALMDDNSPAPDVSEEEAKAYLDKINELQQLRIEKEIAETNQAIATAKLATVTADKSRTDLLTKPIMPVSVGGAPSAAISPVSVADYTNQLSAQPLSPPDAQAATKMAQPAEPEYSVVSVSWQLSHWSAVIGYQGKVYSVSVGDPLPPENARVVRINRNGVDIKQNGKVKTLPVLSSI